MHKNVDAGVASVCCEDAQATEGLLATTANKKDPVSSIPDLWIHTSASTIGTKETELYDLENWALWLGSICLRRYARNKCTKLLAELFKL